MHNDDMLLSFFGGLFATLALILVVEITVAYLLYQGLKKIPERHRATESFMPWLTLIPVAGIAFYWILLPFKIPESFRNYFSENPGNGKEPKDYGKGMGMGAAICSTLLLIPVVNVVAWIPAGIFLLVFMLQFAEMVRQLPASTSSQSPMYRSPSRAMQSSNDKFAQLEKLKQLLDQDILTADEYQSEKRKILQGHEHPE